MGIGLSGYEEYGTTMVSMLIQGPYEGSSLAQDYVVILRDADALFRIWETA